MAETLDTVASISQLLDTALKVRENLKDFRTAPEEYQRLFSEIENLKLLLEALDRLVATNPSSDNPQRMSAPMNKFKKTLEGFAEKSWPAVGDWSKIFQEVAWSLWSKQEATEYLDQFKRFESRLIMWLADIWYDF
ncbi:hypothetical protein MVEN_00697100 [Mycena venus]|uniref:Fungal N-terminal domain-containing protein n=1 Tax=Mycena venus TaxID=2733690 RepID=A0A8H7D332_9AGAR|nr:hypothetical protein MVEN_00697100 [Mycena venus]